MWCLVWVLALLGVGAVFGTSTNDVFPVEEEAEAPSLAMPHAAGLRKGHIDVDVFPLNNEDMDDSQILHHHQNHHHHHHAHQRKHGSTHKVHNIVLHPKPNTACELKPIRQIVTHAHCTSKEMENHVCVGTCFSYTVPQTEPETPGDEMLDYCDSCQASESHWTTIQLDCEQYGRTFQVTKKIQMMTNCSCLPCHPSRGHQANMDNEVTSHSSNGNHLSEFFYKTMTDGPPPELPEEFQLYRKTSLDDLRKSVYQQEQGPHGKGVFKVTPSFTPDEDEEDPNSVVSY